MAEETAFKNGQISIIERLVTLILDRVILHTVMNHSSTSTYMPNFTAIEETLCRQTYVRTHVTVCTYACTNGRTFETGFIRSTLSKSLHKIVHKLEMTYAHQRDDHSGDFWPRKIGRVPQNKTNIIKYHKYKKTTITIALITTGSSLSISEIRVLMITIVQAS